MFTFSTPLPSPQYLAYLLWRRATQFRFFHHICTLIFLVNDYIGLWPNCWEMFFFCLIRLVFDKIFKILKVSQIPFVFIFIQLLIKWLIPECHFPWFDVAVVFAAKCIHKNAFSLNTFTQSKFLKQSQNLQSTFIF